MRTFGQLLQIVGAIALTVIMFLAVNDGHARTAASAGLLLGLILVGSVNAVFGLFGYGEPRLSATLRADRLDQD